MGLTRLFLSKAFPLRNIFNSEIYSMQAFCILLFEKILNKYKIFSYTADITRISNNSRLNSIQDDVAFLKIKQILLKLCYMYFFLFELWNTVKSYISSM